ncbi:TPA: hypothetical protein F3P23_19380 [Aeromonas hydrophila]|uniref:hypothetical protein n=1 Tax=Aeromonas hydrophila TaxID=644 RepID=UPI000FD1604C|nr:hypothetical protein [Aeromonas hydrophila]AZU46714.1 acetyltransferase [Aeromonas hydrophila]MCV3294626.1 hypothetical protein [Aeromonas hydrophila]QBX73274.1 hypothetical protein E4625_22030 [Aeromonas hydrophila]QBX77974.1 hypothetical protein E4630_21805 [Aeromonas hydrophila]WDA24087.1 hypothetical protein PSC74_19020 [Aeromonas hydrophila]
MQLTPLANTQIVIRPFEAGDADEFVRATRESIEMTQALTSWLYIYDNFDYWMKQSRQGHDIAI